MTGKDLFSRMIKTQKLSQLQIRQIQELEISKRNSNYQKPDLIN